MSNFTPENIQKLQVIALERKIQEAFNKALEELGRDEETMLLFSKVGHLLEDMP